MVKKLFVLRIGDYRPDLCQFTIPTIKAYAAKIGAEYIEITHAVHPDMPVTFAKLRVFDMGQDSDWNILVDADIMIHPGMPDVTQFLPPNAVASAFAFDADFMFHKNRFFERDGRNIGIVGNFVVTTKLTHDLWDYSQVFSIVDPADIDLKTLTKRDFIIDEYVLSHNLAKFGLRHTGILPMPQLTEMIVHFGNEESDEEQRRKDVCIAETLFMKWGFQ